MAQHFTLHEIVASLGGQVDLGQPEQAKSLKISRLASLKQAKPGMISFFNDTKIYAIITGDAGFCRDFASRASCLDWIAMYPHG